MTSKLKTIRTPWITARLTEIFRLENKNFTNVYNKAILIGKMTLYTCVVMKKV